MRITVKGVYEYIAQRIICLCFRARKMVSVVSSISIPKAFLETWIDLQKSDVFWRLCFSEMYANFNKVVNVYCTVFIHVAGWTPNGIPRRQLRVLNWVVREDV